MWIVFYNIITEMENFSVFMSTCTVLLSVTVNMINAQGEVNLQ